MFYDNDIDTDSDSYYSEETEFYTGYRSPADEWQVSRQSLFKEFQGSVFSANDKVNRRLARLNEVIAFAESKDTKRINKKNYISDNYSFLQEFIPENIFEKITEIMAFTNKEKKKIARDIRLNVETLATILSLWELELYSTGSYVTESTLSEINEFLKGSSSYGKFRKKGHITTKDIERSESRILRQLYNETIEDKKSSNETELPSRVLEYYRTFILNLDLYLNDNQKKLQEKNSILPFHVYLLAQKKELLKRILPKIALDYFNFYIELNDLDILGTIIEEFYIDKSAMVGELVTQAIVIIEQYFTKIAIIDHMPKKFQTRVKKYRNEFANEFYITIDNHKIISTKLKETRSEDESKIFLGNKHQVKEQTNIDTNELENNSFEMNQININNKHIELQLPKFESVSNTLDFRQKLFLRQAGISEEFYSAIVFSILNNFNPLSQLATYKLWMDIAFIISFIIYNELYNELYHDYHFKFINDKSENNNTYLFSFSVMKSIFLKPNIIKSMNQLVWTNF